MIGFLFNKRSLCTFSRRLFRGGVVHLTSLTILSWRGSNKALTKAGLG